MSTLTANRVSTDGFVVRAGQSRSKEGIADPRFQVKVSSENSDGAYSIVEVRTPPLVGPPVHFHRYEDEWFYVLEGEYRFHIGGQDILAGAGASLYCPRRVAHTFQNVGMKIGRLLTVTTPGGLDLFFADLFRDAPPGTPMEPGMYLKVYDKHNLVFVAPPLGIGEVLPSQPVAAVRKPFLVPRGENRLGHRLDIYGDLLDIKVTREDSEGAMTALEGLIGPNVGPPLHQHEREDECFFVLEGMLEFEVNGKRLIANQGDMVFAPRGSVHTFRGIREGASRMVTAVFPGGLDGFFVELERQERPEMAFPIFGRYGLRICGPPLR